MSDAPVATGYLRLVPTTQGIQGELGQQFTTLGAGAGRSFSSSFLPVLGGMLAVAGGAMLAREVKQFVEQGVQSLARIETITAQTESVIRSTGGAANVTTAEIDALAGALERTTATEAESIQQGANLLLTFKNIRNEVGAGNDIFNQTVSSLVDVARAMGQDPQSAAMQLGKALNDPIRGIAALTRVGITFTEEQKEQIRTLVEAGDVMSAQKIILAELQSQFGGSGAAYAETFAGKLDLVEHNAGTLQERLVTGLMPTFEGFLDVANRTLTGIDESPAFQRIVDRINEIGTDGADDLQRVVDLVDKLASGEITRGSALDELGKIFPTLEPLIELGEQLEPVFPEIREGLLKIVDALTEEGVLDAIVKLTTEGLPPLVALLVALAPLIPPLADLLTTVLVPGLQLTADTVSGFFALFEATSLRDWIVGLVEDGNQLGGIAVGIANSLATIANGFIDMVNTAIGGVEGLINATSALTGLRVDLPALRHLGTISITPGRTSSAPISADRLDRFTGPKLADGGTITRAGWAMVGEAGPELLNLNVGAQVRPLDNIGVGVSVLDPAAMREIRNLGRRPIELIVGSDVLARNADDGNRRRAALGGS